MLKMYTGITPALIVKKFNHLTTMHGSYNEMKGSLYIDVEYPHDIIIFNPMYG